MVEDLAVWLSSENQEKGQALGEIEGVVIHWSAGPYNVVFDAYHYCIVLDERTGKAHVVQTLRQDQLGQHAYMFNHHRIGISFMAMRGCVPTNPGPCPITPAMLQVGAEFTAEFMAWKQLDPRLDFRLGGPSCALLSHAEVDKIIGRCEKWDVDLYWAEFKAAVRDRYAALKAGTAQFAYLGIIKEEA